LTPLLVKLNLTEPQYMPLWVVFVIALVYGVKLKQIHQKSKDEPKSTVGSC
jgi:hypothetical protein